MEGEAAVVVAAGNEPAVGADALDRGSSVLDIRCARVVDLGDLPVGQSLEAVAAATSVGPESDHVTRVVHSCPR